MVQPGGKNFTVILEKLEGRCLRCAGQTTETETVTFQLSAALAAVTPKLQIWLTNETTHFVRLADVVPVGGSFEVTVPKDSIVTASSWFTGQSKATVTIPKDAAFPGTLKDSFDTYPVDGLARYFADNGGSFQVAQDPQNSTNMVYKQWVQAENGVNRWGGNVNPVSLLGNTTWTTLTASVKVKVEARSPPPTLPPTPSPPSPSSNYVNLENQYNGLCLDVRGKGTADGTQVDVWNCVKADNEAFEQNNVTNLLVESGTGKCVTDTGCTAGTGVCLGDCATATKWSFPSDNTIVKVGTSPAQCLQTSSKQLDGNVIVAACNSAPTPQELWVPKRNPSPTPQPSVASAGVCVHADRSGQGTCLVLDGTGAWSLNDQGKSVASGTVKKDVGSEWTTLSIDATATTATPIVDGVSGSSVTLGSQRAGMVSINAGYNVAYYDDFELANAH